MFDWTGVAQNGCPWFALRDPFVQRVLEAYQWVDSGQLETFIPNPSHKLIEGIAYYHRALNVCQSKALEIEREELRKK